MGLVLTIRLQRACNQACGFCHFRDADPQPLTPDEVEELLSSGLRDGAEIVRFTGGEPMLDRRLLRFTERARGLGFSHVEVETNATVASLPGVAERMVRAGVTRVWGALMSADDTANDSITRDPGGAARTWAGLAALAAQSVPIGLAVAVTHANAAGLAALMDRAAAELPGFDSVRFHVVTDPEHPRPYRELEPGLGRACARARKHRLDHRFEPAHAPPPCAFSARFVSIHSPLFASYYVSPESVDGPRVRIAACASCPLSGRCAGYPAGYAALHQSELPQEPPPEELTAALKGQLGGVHRHRASQLSLVQLSDSEAHVFEKPNLRVNWACNQRCRFCWVDFDWAPPGRETVIEQIEGLYARGLRRVALTGGEPTLLPWLSDVVGRAAELGFEWIQLQTNGVLLAEARLAARLAGAGLNHALVSLHSHLAEVSDGITQSPGTWERSVQGIDELVEHGVDVSLSHVLTLRNVAGAREYADFVADRWEGRVGIVWSVAAPITEASGRHDDAIPPLDLAGPAIRAGLERCVERGVPFGGQNDACGVPRCVLGHDPRFVKELPPELANESGFMRPDACTGCDHATRCRGVRREYAVRFGGRGLVPERSGAAGIAAA